MKKNFTYLLLVLLGLTTACVKQPKSISITTLLGTYNGELVVIHNPAVAQHDTLTANLQLSLSSLTGFSVTGDTSTIQAPSYGTFTLGLDTLNFSDKNYTGAPSSKLHLNGTYPFSWNGTTLVIVGHTDTSIYEYVFKQTSTQQ